MPAGRPGPCVSTMQTAKHILHGSRRKTMVAAWTGACMHSLACTLPCRCCMHRECVNNLPKHDLQCTTYTINHHHARRDSGLDTRSPRVLNYMPDKRPRGRWLREGYGTLRGSELVTGGRSHASGAHVQRWPGCVARRRLRSLLHPRRWRHACMRAAC